MDQRTVVIGSGVLGTRFARSWRQRYPDAPMLCTVRRESSRSRVEVPGVETGVLDLLKPGGFGELLDGARRILSSVAPGPGGTDELWSRGVPNLVAALRSRDAVHLVHVSSTGVYAAEDGSEVDEDAELGASERARALVAAERAVLSSPSLRATVLRCSGLVGPERGPQNIVARLAGTVRNDGDAWLNLVWMDDVVEAIARAFERGITGTFNVSGPALRRRDFYDPLLERAGLARIRWEAGAPEAGRRVRADRIVESLGLRPTPVRPEDLPL